MEQGLLSLGVDYSLNNRLNTCTIVVQSDFQISYLVRELGKMCQNTFGLERDNTYE